MKSLPTALSTAQIDSLLATMAGLPSAEVKRHADVVTVYATKRATGERVTVFRAVTQDGSQWHAMAVPGLVTRV